MTVTDIPSHKSSYTEPKHGPLWLQDSRWNCRCSICTNNAESSASSGMTSPPMTRQPKSLGSMVTVT